MKYSDFHSLLRWKMITLPILATSLIQFSSKGWENVTFEPLGSERVDPFTPELKSKVYSPNILKRKCISEVVRRGSIIIFHLSKLWKAKFSIPCDVIFWHFDMGVLTLITLKSERVQLTATLHSQSAPSLAAARLDGAESDTAVSRLTLVQDSLSFTELCFHCCRPQHSCVWGEGRGSAFVHWGGDTHTSTS